MSPLKEFDSEGSGTLLTSFKRWGVGVTGSDFHVVTLQAPWGMNFVVMGEEKSEPIILIQV